MGYQQLIVHFRQSPYLTFGAGNELERIVGIAVIFFAGVKHHLIQTGRQSAIQLSFKDHGSVSCIAVFSIGEDIFDGIAISYEIDPIIEAEP